MKIKSIVLRDCYLLDKKVNDMMKLGFDFKRAEMTKSRRIKVTFAKPSSEEMKKFYNLALVKLQEEVKRRKQILRKRERFLRTFKKRVAKLGKAR